MAKPDYKVYGLADTNQRNAKDSWVYVGSAWCKDGSISIQLNALPINFSGQLILHPNDKEEETNHGL